MFIDESGDFVFSEKGSEHFILTSVSSTNPLISREMVMNTKYELLASGIDTEYFHATEDAQAVRDKFYSRIKTLSYFEIDSVVAEKRKANSTLYEMPSPHTMDISQAYKKLSVEERFYKQVCETLLQYVVHRFLNFKKYLGVKNVVVVLDQCLPNKKREFITKSIKTYIKDKFGIVPYVFFHSTKSDINSQVADYCCWAIKKKWSDNELRPYGEIKANIKSEFDIFKTGTTFFY